VKLEVKDDHIPLSKVDGSGISFFIDLTTERELNVNRSLRKGTTTDGLRRDEGDGHVLQTPDIRRLWRQSIS